MFLVHIWAVVNILVILPSWALRLGLFELLSVTAYALVFALAESLLIWLLLLLLSILLPKKILRAEFLPQSATFVFILALISGLLHFSQELIYTYQQATLIFLALILALALFLSYRAGKSRKYHDLTANLLSRIIVLSGIYVFFDIFGLFIIMARNI